MNDTDSNDIYTHNETDALMEQVEESIKEHLHESGFDYDFELNWDELC